MGKARKERVGRKRLRDAFERLKRSKGTTSEPEEGHNALGDAPGHLDGVRELRQSRVDRKARKRLGLVQRLEEGPLGLRRVATKRQRPAARSRRAFSFELLLKELDNAHADEQQKQVSLKKMRLDFSRQKNRARMMAQFSRRMLEVHGDAAYCMNPLETTMMHLDKLLPMARTRGEVDEEWRKEQSKAMKAKGKKKPGWYEK